MYLPNSENAYISEMKVRDYLLNINHIEGGSKAKYFGNYGFNLTNEDDFVRSLKSIVQQNEVHEEIRNKFGTKYIIYGRLRTPDDRNPEVTTIWIIENNANIPKLVTAYPR